MADYGSCPVCMTKLERAGVKTCGAKECVKEWGSWSLNSRVARKRYASLSLRERMEYDAETAERLKPDPNYVPSLDIEPEKMDYMELLTPKAKAEIVKEEAPPPPLQPSDNRTVEDEKEARRLRNLAIANLKPVK